MLDVHTYISLDVYLHVLTCIEYEEDIEENTFTRQQKPISLSTHTRIYFFFVRSEETLNP